MQPTGKETFFDKTELIVSKTDLKGHITYANECFLKIAGYDEEEVIGHPHKLIRHPDMPRCVFKLLWDSLQAGDEIFAYVVNLTKNGDHYWVLAHVTPSFDNDGKVEGYHSTRRVAKPETLKSVIIPLYKELKAIEDSQDNRKEGLKASYAKLLSILQDKNTEYDEFVAELSHAA